MTSPETKHLHDTLDFIGLRAHATTVGLLQLCTELVRAGTLDLDAIDRIKLAIHEEIMISHRRDHNRAGLSQLLKDRLDAIFPYDSSGERLQALGDVQKMKSALDPQV